MTIDTPRLEIRLLGAEQLSLWLNDLPRLEQELSRGETVRWIR